MERFMVVCTFIDGTDMAEVMAVIPEEQAQVRRLEDEGLVGVISISMPRRTVFIETFAPDAETAATTVKTLPMARWWELDVFPLGAAPAGEASGPNS